MKQRRITLMLLVAAALAFTALDVSGLRASYATFADATTITTNNLQATTLVAPTLGSPAVTGVGSTATVDLSWSYDESSANRATDWLVQRSAGACPGASFSTIATVARTDPSPDIHQDTPGAPGVYCYAVRAKQSGFISPLSNQQEVTIAPDTTKLVFTTSAPTITAGTTSSTITIQRQDAGSNPTTFGSLTIDLTTTSLTGAFRNVGDSMTLTQVTISNGSSTTDLKYTDTTAGTPTIKGAENPSTGLADAIQVVTVNPAAADHLVFKTQPGSGTTGAPFGQPVVTSKDQFGNDSSVGLPSSLTLTISKQSGPTATLVGTTTKNIGTSGGTPGVATFADLEFDVAGTYSLLASAPALTNATSNSFNVSAGAVAKLLLVLPGETAAPGATTGKTGTPTAQTAGTSFNVTVLAVDSTWNQVPSTDTVSITSSDVNGTMPANAALIGGARTFSVTLNTAGTRSLTATDVSDGTKTASTANVTVNVGAFAKLLLLLPGETAAPGTIAGKTGTPTAQTAGTQFAATVQATDAHGNPVSSGDSVAFTSTDGAAILPLAGPLTGGIRNVNITLKTVGSHTVTVTDVTNGSIAPDSSTVQVNSGAATQLSIETAANGSGVVVPTQNVTAGQSVTAFAISRDASNNFVANLAVTWSITANTGGVVAGDLVAAGDNKSATFTGHLVGATRLRAVHGTLGTTDSNTLTVVAGPASKLTFTTSPSNSTAGVAFPTQPVVAVQDAGGNTITSATNAITLSITAGTGTSGAVLTCATNPLNATSGVATFGGCKINLAGPGYRLTASASGLTSANSAVFDIAVPSSTLFLRSSLAGNTSVDTLVTPGGGGAVRKIDKDSALDSATWRSTTTVTVSATTSWTLNLSGTVVGQLPTASVWVDTLTNCATGPTVPGRTVATTVQVSNGSNLNPSTILASSLTAPVSGTLCIRITNSNNGNNKDTFVDTSGTLSSITGPFTQP